MVKKTLTKDDVLAISISDDFRITNINHHALSFFQWDNKTAIQQPFFNLCEKNKITTRLTAEILQSALKKQLQFFDVVHIPNKLKQTILWTLTSEESARNILMTGIKLTNYHGVENIANKTQAYLENIINNVPHFIFWKGLDSIFLGCNKKFSDSAGLSDPREIMGKSDNDLPWKDQAELYRADDQDVIQSGIAKLNIEEPNTNKAGEITVILTSKVPLTDEHGNIFGILGIYTDITDMKKKQKQLEIAMEQAEAASRVKTEFIANMSHDIRTPITGILGLSHLLKNQVTSIKNKQYVTLIMSATNELLALLNDIIETVQVDSHLIQKNNHKFSLSALINHNTNLILPAITHKSLTLNVNVDSSAPENLIGDKKHLDKILLNLLGNATKFTKKGSITLNIRAIPIPEKTNSTLLEIQIIDTGQGFSKDQQKNIFDYFTRLNPSYEGIYKGSGLGLYLVKKYVDDLDGTIEVISDENKGSTFTITIPFTLTEAGREEILQDIEENSANTDSLNHILVVEDNHVAAAALQYQLSDMKCKHILSAASATEALKKLKKNTVNLIILDIGLPDFSGIQLTEQIRQLEDPIKSKTRIVVLTGHTNKKIKEQCAALGIEQVLTKPMPYEQLKLLVNKPES